MMERQASCLLVILLCVTCLPQSEPKKHERVKIPANILQNVTQGSAGKTSEAAVECGCACDNYYDKLIKYLEYLKGLTKPRMLPVHMMSAGCDDTGFEENCGGSSIKVDGVEYSRQTRGHNVVVLNSDGSVWTTKAFDTWNFFSGSDGDLLNDFLLSVPLGKIVLIAVHDSGDRHVDSAIEGLASVNADTDNLNTDFRSSWILVGYRGTKMPWVFQASNPRGKGPTVVNTFIPLPSTFCAHSVSL